MEIRLKDAFPGIKYEVHGTPKSLSAAKHLAENDKYQFEWWAVSLVDAVPYKSKKKGADSGIDGIVYFKEGKKTERVIVSVKGGKNINVSMIRDLKAVVEREKAKMGLFITLYEPTKPMLTEAIKSGFYKSDYGMHEKIQIRTVDELLHGKKADIPLVTTDGFKKASIDHGEDKQVELLL
jgi:site-specific DNA-methyltransferase (adenine-specific)